MPRAMWSGAINFGLVSVPVKLYSAVSRKNVSFNQIDVTTNSRIKQKKFNSDDVEVEKQNIAKGYEIAKDSYVLMTPEELGTLVPESSKIINITDFVLESEVDPIYYDSPYYLLPEELVRKSYVLLVKALANSKRVAVANFIMRGKSHLAIIRAKGDLLVMSTIVYHDEVSATDELPDVELLSAEKVTKQELEMANQLIDSLSTSFEPAKYIDEYRIKLLELIQSKAEGETIHVERESTEDDAEVLDLLSALQASVDAAKGSGEKEESA